MGLVLHALRAILAEVPQRGWGLLAHLVSIGLMRHVLRPLQAQDTASLEVVVVVEKSGREAQARWWERFGRERAARARLGPRSWAMGVGSVARGLLGTG